MMGGGMREDLRFRGTGVPAGWVLVYLGFAAARANRLREARWESLVETYPDHVEQLGVTFGKLLRVHYPQVMSHHRRDRLEFNDAAADTTLALRINEPLRSGLGWGGASLEATRGGAALSLPVRQLFLCFARGHEPEWVARMSGFPFHRAAVVNETVAAHVAARVFGAPAGAQVTAPGS